MPAPRASPLAHDGCDEKANGSGRSAVDGAPTLKTRKSLDWISKGFKRKSSSQTLRPKPIGTESNTSSGLFGPGASQPLLTIPGSPVTNTYSPPSSIDDKSGDDYSQSSASPQTPGRLSNHSKSSTATTKKVSTLASPSAQSFGPNIHDTPVIPITLKDYHRQKANPSTLSLPPSVDADVAPPQRDSTQYEKLLLDLSSRKVLRTMLDDPVGLWKFGQFMASEMNAETLVFWLNAEQHRNDLKRLYSLTQRIHSLHIPSNAPLALNITSNERSAIERSIRAFTNVNDPFKEARDTAFHALYLDAWPRFLQWRLELLHAKMAHGGLTPPQTSFTLADPSQDRDQPLLLASDGFLDLSGYSRTDVLMRNCRFLQGPGTAPAVVDRIRQACKNGTHLTEMLLNYRKDGVPFWSLLRIIPLRNANGKLKYLLGAQINVTAVLAATPDLAHLLADELDPMDMPPPPPFEHDLAESQKHNTNQAMRSYLNSLDKPDANASSKKSEMERRDIANKSLLSKFRTASPTLSSASSYHASSNASTVTSSPVLGFNNVPAPVQRPRSAARDMHLQAAAALAFDNTSRPTSWTGVPASARPTTSASLFQRPGTAISMMDTEGKALAQLSLAEQTKAFNEASSYYLILDSTTSTILFHSANMPASISIGGDFVTLVGQRTAKQIKDHIGLGERIDMDSVSFNVGQLHDPAGQWKRGVKICITPLKDQINEVGAVVVLISSAVSIG